MKETGVVRRIDELGRIVIPKEIRNRLKVSPGDMLDIYTDKDMITLKKYSILDDFSLSLIPVVEALKNDKIDFIISTRQEVLISTLNLDSGLELSKDFLKMFFKSEDLELAPSKVLELANGFIPNRYILGRKIFKDGDIVGYIIMLGRDSFMRLDKELFQILTKYINNYITS